MSNLRTWLCLRAFVSIKTNQQRQPQPDKAIPCLGADWHSGVTYNTGNLRRYDPSQGRDRHTHQQTKIEIMEPQQFHTGHARRKITLRDNMRRNFVVVRSFFGPPTYAFRWSLFLPLPPSLALSLLLTRLSIPPYCLPILGGQKRGKTTDQTSRPPKKKLSASRTALSCPLTGVWRRNRIGGVAPRLCWWRSCKNAPQQEGCAVLSLGRVREKKYQAAVVQLPGVRQGSPRRGMGREGFRCLSLAGGRVRTVYC